jgi:poly(A) polymerase
MMNRNPTEIPANYMHPHLYQYYPPGFIYPDPMSYGMMTMDGRQPGIPVNPDMTMMANFNPHPEAYPTEIKRTLPPEIIEAYKILDDTPSSDYEESNSEILEHLLAEEMDVYETKEQKAQKEKILAHLNDILDLWMERVKRRHSIGSDEPSGNAKLLPYGSYKLGVSSPSGDVDALVLAPHYVDRNEDFFGMLYPLLEELSRTNSNIQDLTLVNQENTTTPLIKMTFHKLPIDMVFARVNYEGSLDDFVRNEMISNNEYMIQMDEQMKRSYNGIRNAEMLLQSLRRPNDSNLVISKKEDVFRITLKCIKLWSKQNGLGANKYGYLGGISLAILTAKICQLYPFKCPAKLLEVFFWIFSDQWNWDQWYIRIERQEEGVIKRRLMHIITPASPQMNSTYNVNYSTRNILLSRMKDAYLQVKEILYSHTDRNPELTKTKWKSFFKKYNFFDAYEHYIEINIVGSQDHEYIRWLGYIESKIRILCELIEDLFKTYDIKIHPWPDTYERSSASFLPFTKASSFYIGLQLNQDVMESIDLNGPIIQFIKYIDEDWRKENPTRDAKLFNLAVNYLTREEIPLEVISSDNNESLRKLSQNEETTNEPNKEEEPESEAVQAMMRSASKEKINEDQVTLL